MKIKLVMFGIFFILMLKIFINGKCNSEKEVFQSTINKTVQRSFSLDLVNDIFLKDGKPFRYISGSVLYTRIPEIYWLDRLSKFKAAGLNTIQFYVPWNFHEYEEGKYNFHGNGDLNRFLTIARQLDLLVLLRSGPYMCGEWDFGGIPAWLLRKNPNMILRSSNKDYLSAVLKWYSVLLPIIKPHLYQNNGSIIMVQVENEYGSFYTCDNKYLRALYDTVRSYLGDDIIIYSTDGYTYSYLICGSSDRRIFSTVDFGTSDAFNPKSTFSDLRKWQPNGPLVNSEYYSGWLDSWGSKHNTVSESDVIRGLKTLYNYSFSVNVNMYMFHGGTSFGFWNGANSPPYLPQITSYDYDAPLSEAGDITSKYLAIRNALMSINPDQPFPPVPPNTTKASYGSIAIKQNLNYLINLLNQNNVTSKYPVTMEYLGHYQGYMIYFTTTSHYISTNSDITTSTIQFTRIGDCAYIFTSNANNSKITYHGLLNRNMKNLSLSIPIEENLIILVENSGHINYGRDMINDVKGIIGNVTLNGNILVNWKHFPINLTNIHSTQTQNHLAAVSAPTQSGLFSSSFYLYYLPQDTFLKTSNFSKGIVLINGNNLGRFWNTKGPQYTLFVPKSFLNIGLNTIDLFELEGANCKEICFVEFIDQPILNGPVHSAL